jgi:hypothetical protein
MDQLWRGNGVEILAETCISHVKGMSGKQLVIGSENTSWFRLASAFGVQATDIQPVGSLVG